MYMYIECTCDNTCTCITVILSALIIQSDIKFYFKTYYWYNTIQDVVQDVVQEVVQEVVAMSFYHPSNQNNNDFN